MDLVRRTFSLSVATLLAVVPMIHATALALNETAPVVTSPAPTTTTTTAAAATPSSASNNGTSTDRTTMIIVVACVVAVFAVAVVVVILRTRRNGDAAPAPPKETGGEDAYRAMATARATATTRPRASDAAATSVGVKATAIHRPSLAYTERSTIASLPRDSEFVLESRRTITTCSGTKRDEIESEDDVAMLESRHHSRELFSDDDDQHTFLSAVRFDDSSRSLDVDAYRRSTSSMSYTSLSTDSVGYWEKDEDDSFVEASTTQPPRRTLTSYAF